MSRFGGLMSRASMVTNETAHAEVLDFQKVNRTQAVLHLRLIASSKELRGVKCAPDRIPSKGSTVAVSRVAGRWIVL